uniref:Integrase, catalytic region, zinc finger, CCHC-type, peptidase aspartic, catalytic n=1 Tax=Tanacetum cinerariifolium TaxID=118510 RepID=A0A6L2JAD9_TANCI|nr:integrase, catalytic region, zinc finger, CCHC-type, peptidase aspartic, catalytic [Tanacetum cinerariifolium]
MAIFLKDIQCAGSEHHEVHKMHDDVQPNCVVVSDTEYTGDNNMILYDQYVKDNAEPVVRNNTSSVSNDASMIIINEMPELTPQCDFVKEHTKVDALLTAELKIYKEQVKLGRSRLMNFVKKFIRTVRFKNDHFGAIMGKHLCVVQDTDGVELIKDSRGSNLYTISVEDMMKSSSICLLSKASKTKSWLWHHRLNHLNFDTINDLARKDLAEAVATACYTQNRSLIHTLHNKTPYELVHNRKPDLTFLRVFGALCYPTNDSEDLGKLQPIADIGIFVGYVPSRNGYRIYNKRRRRIMETIHNDWDTLFQPLFNEYFNPSPRAVSPVLVAVAAPRAIDPAGSPSSTIIDQDVPSANNIANENVPSLATTSSDDQILLFNAWVPIGKADVPSSFTAITKTKSTLLPPPPPLQQSPVHRDICQVKCTNIPTPYLLYRSYKDGKVWYSFLRSRQSWRDLSKENPPVSVEVLRYDYKRSNVSHVDVANIDKFCLHDLNEMMIQLGYGLVDLMYYHFLRSRLSLDYGLHPSIVDGDLLELAKKGVVMEVDNQLRNDHIDIDSSPNTKCCLLGKPTIIARRTNYRRGSNDIEEILTVKETNSFDDLDQILGEYANTRNEIKVHGDNSSIVEDVVDCDGVYET